MPYPQEDIEWVNALPAKAAFDQAREAYIAEVTGYVAKVMASAQQKLGPLGLSMMLEQTEDDDIGELKVFARPVFDADPEDALFGYEETGGDVSDLGPYVGQFDVLLTEAVDALRAAGLKEEEIAEALGAAGSFVPSE